MGCREDIQATYSNLSYGGKVGLLAFLGAALTMFAFLISMYYTLPLGDQARQMNLFFAILDPFVLTVAFPVAACGAAVAFPFAYFCLKERNVFNCSLFVSLISIVSLVILTVNRYDIFWAIPVILLTLCICLLLCKFVPITFFRASSTWEKKNGNSSKSRGNEGTSK